MNDWETPVEFDERIGHLESDGDTMLVFSWTGDLIGIMVTRAVDAESGRG